jgi:hypothetical protein
LFLDMALIRKFCQVVLMMVIATLESGAQTDPKAAQVPTPVNGESASLAIPSPREAKNLMSGGLSVGTVLDDNAYSSNTHRVSNLGYQLLPTIALEQSRARLHWGLSYLMSFTANQRLTPKDSYWHDLGLNVQYRITPRLTARLRDSFNVTSSFSDRLVRKPLAPEFGVLQGPNESVITPRGKRTDNVGSVDLTYQLSASNLVGLSGTISTLHSRDAFGSTSRRLIDTESKNAGAFLSRRLSRRHSIGVTYQFQKLSFQQGLDRTVAHSLLYFHTISLQPNLTLSFFAGPERSRTNGQAVEQFVLGPFFIFAEVPVVHKAWSFAGGTTFSWQGKRMSFRSGYVRRISDGGGLLGAVHLHSMNAEMRRQLAARWTTELGIGFTSNRLLNSSASSSADIRTLYTSAGVERRLAENLSLGFRYARDHQAYGGSLLTRSSVDHDRLWMSLNYYFNRPLGR